MKCFSRIQGVALAMSLPVRGAWVEILIQRMACCCVESLPVRGRGLKSADAGHHGIRRRSLPVRGAWVEIACAIPCVR